MESQENNKTPQQRLRENVTKGNEEFLLDLEGAQTIDELIDVLHAHTYVEDGEHLVFEVGEDGEGNPDLTSANPVDQLVSALITFKNDPPTDALGVDEWFDHKGINKAVKRIFAIE